LLEHVKEIYNQLQGLTQRYKDYNYQLLLEEMISDYRTRQVGVEFLTTEKLELMQALEQQLKDVEKLRVEKETFVQYLNNVISQIFMRSIKAKNRNSDPILGPYTFTIRDLEKMGVIIPNDVSKNTVSLKFSCTTPGNVNIYAKFKAGSKFFEIDLAVLMDELVIKDVLEFDGLIVDIRKFLAFLYKHLGC